MVAIDPTAIFAAIGGALMGSYGTYLFRERSQKKRENEQIENLRKSLLAELGSFDEFVTQKASNYVTQLPIHSQFSTEVYRSNSTEISLLTPNEAEAVIRFYSGAIKLDETLNTTRELILDSEKPLPHDLTNLNESIDISRNEWKTCVLSLLSNLDDYPKAINIEGERIQIDESISPGNLLIVLNRTKAENSGLDIEFLD